MMTQEKSCHEHLKPHKIILQTTFYRMEAWPNARDIVAHNMLHKFGYPIVTCCWMVQQDLQMCAMCCMQQCCNMLPSNVAFVCIIIIPLKSVTKISLLKGAQLA